VAASRIAAIPMNIICISVPPLVNTEAKVISIWYALAILCAALFPLATHAEALSESSCSVLVTQDRAKMDVVLDRQRSITTSLLGREQQISTLPAAGGSMGWAGRRRSQPQALFHKCDKLPSGTPTVLGCRTPRQARGRSQTSNPNGHSSHFGRTKPAVPHRRARQAGAVADAGRWRRLE